MILNLNLDDKVTSLLLTCIGFELHEKELLADIRNVQMKIYYKKDSLIISLIDDECPYCETTHKRVPLFKHLKNEYEYVLDESIPFSGEYHEVISEQEVVDVLEQTKKVDVIEDKHDLNELIQTTIFL